MKKLLRFFKNVWYFRRELWDFQWWDYSYTLSLFSRSLQSMSDNFEIRGNEIDSSRLKKVEKMKRAVQIINNIKSADYIGIAEIELGELKPVEYLFKMNDAKLYEIIKEGENEDLLHNEIVYKRAHEIEESEWNELCDIIRGQDNTKYKPKKQDWDEWFDGTGMQNWWD